MEFEFQNCIGNDLLQKLYSQAQKIKIKYWAIGFEV
jgi:hypothetical protein